MKLALNTTVCTFNPIRDSNSKYARGTIIYIHPEYDWCCIDFGPFRECRFMQEVWPSTTDAEKEETNGKKY